MCPTAPRSRSMNDPTNGGRALLLLQDKGVIKLKDGVGFKPGPIDIVANPKKLKIVEIEAAQTPRTLADVAAAAINTNYAVDAKIEPTSAILREDPKGPYVNVIAVRAADKDKPWVEDAGRDLSHARDQGLRRRALQGQRAGRLVIPFLPT